MIFVDLPKERLLFRIRSRNKAQPLTREILKKFQKKNIIFTIKKIRFFQNSNFLSYFFVLAIAGLDIENLVLDYYGAPNKIYSSFFAILQIRGFLTL